MALLWMDSFDHYTTADILEKYSISVVTGSGTSVNISGGNGRRSSNSFRPTSSPNTNEAIGIQKILNSPASSGATFIMGFAFKTPTAIIGSAGMPIATVRDGTTTQVTLRVNNDLSLSVCRGLGTVLGTTTGAIIPAAAYAYIEWKVLIDPSVGTVDVKVNNTSVLSLTTQNTRNSAASQWNSFTIGIYDSISNSTTATSGSMDYDDLYVLDGTGSAPQNDFLGDSRADYHTSTAAGATTGWTPSTGANWQNVDDATPNDDTDYNSAASVLTDTFVVQDAPAVGSTIFGVQTVMSAKKSDAGACSLAPVVRHSGTDNVGTNVNPLTGYAYFIQLYQNNPGTSAAWTESDFNAAEFGYKRTV